MNAVEIASIVASFVSLIVSLLAIALSLYFYTQSKNTERQVAEALASIKAQTDALQKLTGRWMDRFTRAATEPKQPDETLLLLFSAIREIPTNVASQIRTPGQELSPQILEMVVAAWIGTYFYAAVSNVALQGYLPTLEELEPQDRVKQLVDQSYADCAIFEQRIASVDRRLLEANPLAHVYAEALAQWKPLLKDSTMTYRARAAGES